MDPVAIFLLSVAGIFLIGALGEIIFQRTNIPDVIWLILAGIILGPVTGWLSREMLGGIAPFFAAVTLVVVLFDGGSKLRLGELSKAAPRSSLLAVLNFTFSVLIVGVASMGAAFVGWLPESWTWTHGWLLGAILGGSSSIIIMPAMAQAKLPSKIANLVNLESALTDAFCVVGAAAIIDIMLQGASGAASPAVTLLKSFGIGLVVGAVAGVLWLLLLRFLRSSEHAYPVTLAALLGLYVLIDRMGGSAALGILTVAIILGNARVLTEKIGLKESVELDTDVRGFHAQMTFIVKSFFFVFIGAMLGPPWSQLVLGVLLGGLLLAARLPGTYVSMLGKAFDNGDRKMAAVSMPRGMAAGVLATLPVAAGVPGTESLPVVVFSCVLTTILVFAVGFPIIKRQMKVPQEVPAEIVADGADPAAPAAPADPAQGSAPQPPAPGEPAPAPHGEAAPQGQPVPQGQAPALQAQPLPQGPGPAFPGQMITGNVPVAPQAQPAPQAQVVAEPLAGQPVAPTPGVGPGHDPSETQS